MYRFIPVLGFTAAFTFVADTQASTDTIEEVLVIAHPLSGEGLSQAADVLQGAELEQKKAANIGETLAKQPGIHSATFGNAVGRPVIHGLGGPRVRIMEDRIDTLDVSVTSADHAVSVEPFVAERIEVLKGSSTLLYGSGAIGGVVDVHTARIPHELSDKIWGGVETRFNENYDGQTTSFKLNGSVGQWAWHLDGTDREGDDYKIPGATESAALRRVEAEEDPGATETPTRGSLPGSAFDSRNYAAGVSYIDEWGFVGVAVSDTKGKYGLPGGHSHEDGGEESGDETATLELEQTRTDFELGIKNPFGVFTSANFRVGHNNYEHAEIEPSGEVGTVFENKAWEARGELVYETDQWHGAFGLQHTDKAFSAIGEEAFIPPVDTVANGIFWVGERSFAPFDIEIGGRIGETKHKPTVARDERFTDYALSAGLVREISSSWMLGVITDYSSRAPVAEELYSNGPHLVTNAFEVGNANLDNESALNISATAEYTQPRWMARATVYYTAFADFIYQQATGDIEDDLPVLAYRQDDATYYGVDFEVTHKLFVGEQAHVDLSAMFDYVHASVDTTGNKNLPRTPPLRYGLGLHANIGQLNANIDYLRVDDQNDVAGLELPTDAYDDLSVYVGFTVPVQAAALTLFVQGKNLTDDEQRAHTSFIKDVAPAPGRSVEAGIRVLF